jgi:thioredoxin-like negative regulator of GroEL
MEISVNHDSMKTIIITAKNHKKEIARNSKPVLLSFVNTLELSGFMLKRTVDNLSEEFGSEIKVGIVEMDYGNTKLAEKYNICFLPTTVLIQHGEVTDKILGNIRKEDFLKVLESN